MKLFAVVFLFLFAPSVLSQPAEAQLWRCGLPRLDHKERIEACTAAMTVVPEDAAPWHNRGLAHLGLKDYRNAVLDFTGALRRSKDPRTQMMRGHAFSELGEYERALLDLEEAAQAAPKDPDAQNALAWILATAGTPGFRDGKRAVEIARKACELGGWARPAHLDTLAAAYAEAGDFKEAVRWQEKALADPSFPPSEHPDAKQRLALYKAKKPYRHTPG